MLTRTEILQIEKERMAQRQPSKDELRRIPLDRPARLLGRLSSPGQVKDSVQSMGEFSHLVMLAREDGFHTELSQEEVERRLEALQRGDADALRYWVDGQLIVDLRDLGISGRLGPEKRPGLAELMTDLERGEQPDVTGTIYLSSEGVSRLSRDQNRIVGNQLLKLMRQANCRLRVPSEVMNPRIDSDWKELREKFEDAAKQSDHFQKEHFGPKMEAKARRGEHVGTPVPPGFIVDIKGYKSNGAYIFGKWLVYPPHAEVDVKVLEEYIRQQGSKYRTAHALRGLVFPFFPPELKWMETRTSLRNCLKTDEGYVITPEVVDGLANQLALMGTWRWGNSVMIDNNHQAPVPEDLFRQVYSLRNERSMKRRGRGSYYDPLDWEGLLWCYTHERPTHISGHSSDGTWVCDRDYHNGTGPYCFKIDHRIISEPLTTEFLKSLDLRSYAKDVFDELQTRATTGEVEDTMRKNQETHLRNRLANLESYLGSADPELEDSYRRQIKEAKADLRALQQKPTPAPVSVADISRVQHFLANLQEEWEKLSSGLRNRLLRLLIDHVEILYDPGHIQATVVWKTGFRQWIDINWEVGRSGREWLWTEEQDNLLGRLWQTSTQEELLNAFPGRTMRGITTRASRLGLARNRHYPSHWRPWTPGDDARLAELYTAQVTIDDIAAELGRSVPSVHSRACMLKISRRKEAQLHQRNPTWEIHNFYGLEEVGP